MAQTLLGHKQAQRRDVSTAARRLGVVHGLKGENGCIKLLGKDNQGMQWSHYRDRISADGLIGGGGPLPGTKNGSARPAATASARLQARQFA